MALGDGLQSGALTMPGRRIYLLHNSAGVVGWLSCVASDVCVLVLTGDRWFHLPAPHSVLLRSSRS